MKSYRIFGVLILFTNTFCNNQKFTSDNRFNEIFIETQKDVKMNLSELFKEIYYLKLDSSNLTTIGKIDKAIFQKNRIYILDSKTKKIVVFDNNGSCVVQINKEGRGPGEYLNIADFLVDSLSNNIELWDTGNTKILRIDQNGNFISEKPFKIFAYSFCKLSGSIYVFFARNYLNRDFFRKESFNAILVDSNNKVRNSYLPIKELRYLSVVDPGQFVKYGNGVNVAVPYDNYIYYVTANDCQIKYKITFTNYNIPESIFKSQGNENNYEADMIRNRKLMNRINSNKFASGIHNVFENDKILFFQYGVSNLGIYSVIYNKHTRKIHVGLPENDIDFGLFGEPLALIGDTLITYMYPYNLMARTKSLEADKSIDKNNIKVINLMKLSSSLKETNNPIIAKFILKDF